ncbi:MAG: DUF4190 domain-containing protein [Verrucomicrobiota bacterium JB023]|nr:DUF4190 domain-containing protein [Verrucomicrobiota bacterium JB023]
MWFYAKDGKQEGPVENEVIERLHANGELSKETLIWKEGMAQWTALGEVPEFQGQSPATSATSANPSPATFASDPKPQAAGSTLQQPSPSPQLASPPQQNGMALASLILGIASFVCGGPLTGIAAIICGHIAKRQLRDSPYEQTGDGLATAGLVMGYIAVGLTVLAIVAYVILLTVAVGSGGAPGMP